MTRLRPRSAFVAGRGLLVVLRWAGSMVCAIQSVQVAEPLVRGLLGDAECGPDLGPRLAELACGADLGGGEAVERGADACDVGVWRQNGNGNETVLTSNPALWP